MCFTSPHLSDVKLNCLVATTNNDIKTKKLKNDIKKKVKNHIKKKTKKQKKNNIKKQYFLT